MCINKVNKKQIQHILFYKIVKILAWNKDKQNPDVDGFRVVVFPKEEKRGKRLSPGGRERALFRIAGLM